MKKLILLVFILMLFASCQSSSEISREYKENPCQDLQYLKLKKMKVSEMTGRESEYFKNKDKECEKYSKEIKTKKADSDFLFLFTGLGIAAGIIISLFLILEKGH